MAAASPCSLARRAQAGEQAEAFFAQVIALADEFWPLDAAGDRAEDAQGYVFAAFINRNPRDDPDVSQH